MPRLGIALDLGTSGFRAQAIDIDNLERALSTAITTRHPLPGANVMDHLHFALEVGPECAQALVVGAVNRVIDALRIDRAQVSRLAICGNPIQLSLFQGIEIRDLAFAGKRKLEALGAVQPARDARVLKASQIPGLHLPGEIYVPPAVRHEVGADALAMMIQTGILDRDEIALTTDYGTNAEMVLKVGGVVYSGSAATGPALEGQHIEHGLLALPGAISDVEFIQAETQPSGAAAGGAALKGQLQTYVLDHEMVPRPGGTVDPETGRLIDQGEFGAAGITGTGVIALVSQGLRARLIRIPRIQTLDGDIKLPNGLRFTEKDLLEAGKAIGAIRAGHITLCRKAGVGIEDIQTAYMSGASGTYVDALKAQAIGLVPAKVKKIYQVGNTSLAMARDMVGDPEKLWDMKRAADQLRQHHCMFASSAVFKKAYILELSYWTEGMPLKQYRELLHRYGFPEINGTTRIPDVVKTVHRDIRDFGPMGLRIIDDIGHRNRIVFDTCVGDGACVDACPEKALMMQAHGQRFSITLDLSLCNGVACRRCEKACGEKCFSLINLLKFEDDIGYR